MKNKSIFLCIGLLLALVVLGCGLFGGTSEKPKSSNDKNANKTLTDKAVDTVVGTEKTGVPECDEVFDLIEGEMNNPDDDFVTKAAKGLFFNRMKDAIRQEIEKNKEANNSNKLSDMAKNCTEFKKEIEKYKTEHKEQK